MKVLAVNDDQAVLDLVVHFLGIATHHNINAAPSSKAVFEVISETEEPSAPESARPAAALVAVSPPKSRKSCCLNPRPFQERCSAAGLTAVNGVFGPLAHRGYLNTAATIDRYFRMS